MATKVLKLTFVSAEGKNTSLSIANPKADLAQDTVKAAMEKIVAAGAFSKEGVNKFVGVVGAKYYTTQSDAIFGKAE